MESSRKGTLGYQQRYRVSSLSVHTFRDMLVSSFNISSGGLKYRRMVCLRYIFDPSPLEIHSSSNVSQSLANIPMSKITIVDCSNHFYIFSHAQL